MTADELIAEARCHHKGALRRINQEGMQRRLHTLLGFILGAIDYEAETDTPAASIARAIATMLSDLERQSLN